MLPPDCSPRSIPWPRPLRWWPVSGELGTSELLDRFSRSNQRLADLVMSLDDSGWAATAEAPPGHVSVSTVAHHALWDSWVHERDVLVPMGVDAERRYDELVVCLRYSAALGPSMAVVNGTARSVSMRIDTTAPATSFSVEVHDGVVVGPDSDGADLEIVGGAADLIDVFSIRSPLPVPLPSEHAWIRAGLAEMFEAPAGGAWRRTRTDGRCHGCRHLRRRRAASRPPSPGPRGDRQAAVDHQFVTLGQVEVDGRLADVGAPSAQAEHTHLPAVQHPILVRLRGPSSGCAPTRRDAMTNPLPRLSRSW